MPNAEHMNPNPLSILLHTGSANPTVTTMNAILPMQYPKQLQENLSQPSLKKYHHYDNLYLLRP